jgi:uncharacterized phage-associated protein
MKLTDLLNRPEGLSLTFGDDNNETRERLRELILYIADKSANDPNFGSTKLNKILYFSDFVSFRDRGRPITGARYMRWDNGPMPKHLMPVTLEMIEEGILSRDVRQANTYTQIRFTAKRKPRREVFGEDDLKLVDDIIEELKHHNATDVSLKTHGRVWRLTKNGDDLPYEAVFISDAGLSEDAYEWARTLVAKHDKEWRADG